MSFTTKMNTKEAYFMISFFILCIIFTSCTKNAKEETLSFNVLMKKQFANDINAAIKHLDTAKIAAKGQKNHFLKSRENFKKLEPILTSLDIENYRFLNQPNILKVEEEDFTDIKINKPSGYQVLEELIFTDNPDNIEINKHLNLVSNRLRLIKENINFNHLKKYHFLWLFRKSIIQVSLTGTTGFDSPVLENSLVESRIVYKSLLTYLSFFKNEFKDESLFKNWVNELNNTINTLSSEFDTFDRYQFTKNHTHNQLQLWNKTSIDWAIEFPFELAIKNTASSLYSSSTFNTRYFAEKNSGEMSQEKIKLGKKLFYDRNLSANKTISCASCHHKDKAFTDGLKTGIEVNRNTPTLLYSGLQQGFFYDNRAGSLEGQIIAVIENKNEFHTDLETLRQVVLKDSFYFKKFNSVFKTKTITESHVRNAIASYIRSLSPFNSKFDRNINDLENTLTKNEINGFNLFNGKAKCATCHFAPLFNGTVPPNFSESELEFIGVPETNDTINAKLSDDLGRFYVYNTDQKKHFFKTSTVRNISKTSPYMHNGVFQSLEQVIDFYNKGGGHGIGIKNELQTLPSDHLNLTETEKNNLILFLKTLEDTLPEDY